MRRGRGEEGRGKGERGKGRGEAKTGEETQLWEIRLFLESVDKSLRSQMAPRNSIAQRPCINSEPQIS